MSEEKKSRPGTNPRVFFLFLGTLWLAVIIGELITGKIAGRHAIIAIRSESPITYWFFVLLSLLPTVLMFYVGTRPMGAIKRKKPNQSPQPTRSARG